MQLVHLRDLDLSNNKMGDKYAIELINAIIFPNE